MITTLINRIFRVGSERSKLVKKNIAQLTVLRIISSISGFIIIPLTINYVSPSKYGIWLTINSIVSWFGLIDLGLGNGFRNKFTEALAKNDYKLGRSYLSTTLAINIPIVFLFLISFLIANQYLDWTSILNFNIEDYWEIKHTILLVVIFFCLRFVFNTISVLLTADQKPALSNLIDTISSLISLFVIFILTKTLPASLISLSLSLSVIPVITLIIASFYYFSKDYKKYIPSIRYINKKYVKGLFSLGIKFFLIQISLVLTLSLNNILFSHYFSPDVVTEYNIAYKYFGISTIIMSIVAVPIWSAVGDAYTLGDYTWIKNSLKKFSYILLILTVLTFIQIIFANIFYNLWVGDAVKVSFTMSLLVAIYIIIYNGSLIYNNFINGTGKIKWQFYLTVFGAILYLPIVYLCLKIFHFGISSIIIGNILFLLPVAISSLIQIRKIIKLNK